VPTPGKTLLRSEFLPLLARNIDGSARGFNLNGGVLFGCLRIAVTSDKVLTQ